jgi:hypothetical protein
MNKYTCPEYSCEVSVDIVLYLLQKRTNLWLCIWIETQIVIGKYLFYIAQNITYYPLKFVPYLQNVYMYVRI